MSGTSEVPISPRSEAQQNTKEDVQGESYSEGEEEASGRISQELTQTDLAKRLGCRSNQVKQHWQQGAEHFAQWSQQLDPDGVAWKFQREFLRKRYYVPYSLPHF